MIPELLESEIILENKFVQLIPFQASKEKELGEIIFSDEIWKYMGHYIRTSGDLENYVKQTIDSYKQKLSYPFLVVDKSNDRVAGSTRFGNISVPSEKCEIGWTWYGKDFQGTGINKACKYELLKYGFESIGFRRIQFSVDEENARSQRAVEKIGAKKEGIFRNNYIDSDGISKNDIYYSIIREEWLHIKTMLFSEFD